MPPFEIAAVLISSYLIGSIPTALIISRVTRGVDIRAIGDGNMGARNVFHQIGPAYGVAVAAMDFAKGALPVFLAQVLGFKAGWVMLAGLSSIAGHDFPLFAGFKGGQGLATTLGTILVLFPLGSIIGLAFYAILFLIIRNSNKSFAFSGAAIAFVVLLSHQWGLLAYTVGTFLFVPVKMAIDNSRRKLTVVGRRPY